MCSYEEYFSNIFSLVDTTLILNLAPLSLVISTGTYFDIVEMVLKFYVLYKKCLIITMLRALVHFSSKKYDCL